MAMAKLQVGVRRCPARRRRRRDVRDSRTWASGTLVVRGIEAFQAPGDLLAGRDWLRGRRPVTCRLRCSPEFWSQTSGRFLATRRFSCLARKIRHSQHCRDEQRNCCHPAPLIHASSSPASERSVSYPCRYGTDRGKSTQVEACPSIAWEQSAIACTNVSAERQPAQWRNAAAQKRKGPDCSGPVDALHDAKGYSGSK